MELRKVFDQFDTENNGIISYEEFEAAMKKLNYPEQQLKEMFDGIVSRNLLGVLSIIVHQPYPPLFVCHQDVNKNGHIMYTEFLAAALEAQGCVETVLGLEGLSSGCLEFFLTIVSLVGCRHIEEERVAEAFDRLDSDDSGFISRQNLRDFLGVEGTNERIDQIIKEGDKDNDGQSKCQLHATATHQPVFSQFCVQSRTQSFWTCSAERRATLSTKWAIWGVSNLPPTTTAVRSLVSMLKFQVESSIPQCWQRVVHDASVSLASFPLQ